MYLTKTHKYSITPAVPGVPAQAAYTVCTPSAPSSGGSGGLTPTTSECRWVWVPSTNESIGMGGVVNGGSWAWICG